MPKLKCIWCEEHLLMLMESAQGFYVTCSQRFTSCPDTTGAFPTAQEAIQCATEEVRSAGLI
jgi:hypothetical protein